jgi:hypothetical protein
MSNFVLKRIRIPASNRSIRSEVSNQEKNSAAAKHIFIKISIEAFNKISRDFRFCLAGRGLTI